MAAADIELASHASEPKKGTVTGAAQTFSACLDQHYCSIVVELAGCVCCMQAHLQLASGSLEDVEDLT